MPAELFDNVAHGRQCFEDVYTRKRPRASVKHSVLFDKQYRRLRVFLNKFRRRYAYKPRSPLFVKKNYNARKGGFCFHFFFCGLIKLVALGLPCDIVCIELIRKKLDFVIIFGSERNESGICVAHSAGGVKPRRDSIRKRRRGDFF